MKSKKVIRFSLLVFFMSFLIIGFAQTTYRIQFEHPEDDRFSNLIENSQGEIIVIGTRNNNYLGYSDYKGLIYKIGLTGDTISRTYRFADTAITFHSICENPDGSYLIIGTAFPPPYHDHLMMTMILDSELNYLSKKVFAFPNYTHFQLYHTLADADGYYLLGKITNEYEYGYKDHLFCRIGYSGDTIYTKLYPGVPDPIYFENALFNRDSTEIRIIGQSYNGEDIPSILKLDMAFNILEISTMPDPYQLRQPMTIKWVTDSTLLLMGRYDLWQTTGIGDDKIGISIIDTSFTYSPVTYFGYDETSDYPAYTIGFDFRSNDSIFIMGTIGIAGMFWPTQNNSVIFGHLDGELNTRVLQYFGGDSYYRAQNIHVCKDGGVLMTALSYNDEINDWENDIVFWKVDKNGLITGIQDQEITLNIPPIFPNPGNEMFFLDCGKLTAEMELFNMTGLKVMDYLLNSGTNKIVTNSLKPGIYLCILKFSNGTKETIKWVKQ